ncbi:MAG: methyltransferase domain-containing protein [Thermoanaerobaculia bacterium]|nr:methyltransferase domain-containing protein [Thermoanaerobaculia bacterium]
MTERAPSTAEERDSPPAGPVACSIASNNYLPFVRVLARSFLEHHPDGRFFVCLVDQPHPRIPYEEEPFEVVLVRDLGIPSFRNLAFRYSVVELNTAVKPFFLRYLHDRQGAACACYFDPDILVTSDLGPLYDALREVDAVLTPHILQPLEDKASPADRDFLLTGTFNLGFVGFRFTEASRRFLDWWQRKLFDECLHEIERGLFVDQRWMDLAPSFLPQVEILRDPGYNVAYWNLAHRTLTETKSGWALAEGPLRFFHFSGFDPHAVDRVSKYQNRFRLSQRPDLGPLFFNYRDQLLDAGYERLSSLPYAYGEFSNGVRVPLSARRALAEEDRAGSIWADPFDVEAEGEGRARSLPSFYDWLRGSTAEVCGIGLPRICQQVWEARPDVQKTFPQPESADLIPFARWFLDQGAGQAGVSPSLLQELKQSLTEADDEREAWLVGRIGHFDNGVRVPPRARAALASLDPAGARWPRPARTGPNSYYEWLLKPVTEAPVRIHQLAHLIWSQRADVQAAYSDLESDQAESFVDWLLAYGRAEEHLDDVFLDELVRSANEVRGGRLRKLLAQASSGPPAWNELSESEMSWLATEASGDDPSIFVRDPHPVLPRIGVLIHGSRPDLQESFPEPLTTSRNAFAYWLLGIGRVEYHLPARLLAPVERDLPFRSRWSARIRGLRKIVSSSSRPVRTVETSVDQADTSQAFQAGNEDLEAVHDTWEALAQSDPLWAILSEDDKRHGRWDLEDFFATGRQEIDDTLDELQELGLEPPGGAALDFGCGAGRLTRGMAPHFRRAVGVDISETMVRLAREHTPEDNVSYVHNPADHLGAFPDNSFSFIYTGRVLQHIRPDLARNYIRDFFRILEPGGVAVFQVPGEIRGGDAELSTLAEGAYEAAIEVLNAPSEVAAGASFELDVRITNRSPHTWPSVETLGIYQIRLANQWLDSDGHVAVSDDGRTALKRPIEPGESELLQLIASAPTEAGRHEYQIDLVQEFITWFGDHGSEPAHGFIEVTLGDEVGTAAEASSAAHAGIEMHVIAEREVEALIEESGGELVAVEHDSLAGPEWISLSYRARKSSTADTYLERSPQENISPLQSFRSPRARPWSSLQQAAEEVGENHDWQVAARKPLNRFLAALWSASDYLQTSFPLDDDRGRHRFLHWLHLANGRQVDVQDWLLPDIDWGWFERPCNELEPVEGKLFTNFEWFIWSLREDLRKSYPLDQQEGRHAYRQWVDRAVATDYSYEIEKIEDRLGPERSANQIPGTVGSLEPGIQVVEHELATLGIQEDARTIRAAFDSVGLEYAAIEVFNTALHPERASADYRYRANLLHVNADLMAETVGRLGPQALDGRYTIAYLLWELPACPQQWASALDLVDEVWVPSRYVQEVFAPISPVPVVHLPYGVDVSDVETVHRGEFGLPDDRFLFLQSFDFGSYVERKNPRAVLDAFRSAFDPDDRSVGLVLKTVNADPKQEHWRRLLDEIEADPRLFLVDEMLDRGRLLGLTASCDAYVSLHRAEGFGRGPAEAMALGKPVVVTDFSGNRDYTDASNAGLVECRLTAVGKGQYPGGKGQVWAEPDVDHAARQMRRLVDEPQEAQNLGRAARRTIRSRYGSRRVGERMAARLRTLGLVE